MSTKRWRMAAAASLGLLMGVAILWWWPRSTPREQAGADPGGVATAMMTSVAPTPARVSSVEAPRGRPVPPPAPIAPASPPAATAAIRFERAKHEWQGMLPYSNEVWPCPENVVGCGMARACVDGMCAPCVADDECLGSELCVLGICMVQELVGCQSAADCASDQVCMLSGFTPLDDRNNSDMKSKCVRDHWDEDSPDDVATQRERRLRQEADLAYQNATARRGPPAAYSVTPHGELAAEALRRALSAARESSN